MRLSMKVTKRRGHPFIVKKKFIILSLDEYKKLKEAELEKIIREAEEDYKQGRVIKETAEEHFKRLEI